MRFLVVLALLYAAAALVFNLIGAPSPYLFAGVVAGAICTFRLPDPRPFPGWARALGLAVIGVAAGSTIDRPVVHTLLEQPAAVLGGALATLTVSMAAGQVLRLSPDVDAPTAIYASIAGGASGISAIAREMGADEAIVMTLQYLRVLLVLLSVPLIAPLLGATSGGGPAAPSEAGWNSLPYAVIAVAAGLLLAQLLSFSASRLIFPMVVATGLALAGVVGPAGVPPVLLNSGYAAIGLMVGFSLTAARLRQIARLMHLALLQIVLSIGVCALIGVAFSQLTGVGRLDGYLATTPGGLPAVIAIAIDSGAAVGIIITLQLVRIFVSLLLAPAVGALIRRRAQGRGDEGPSDVPA